MEAMMNMPGLAELGVLAVMMLSSVIPIAIAVWVIVTLARIRRDVAAIRQRLEASQQ